jgi:hypothetical protein
MLERELESLLQTLVVLEEVFEGDQQCGAGGGDCDRHDATAEVHGSGVHEGHSGAHQGNERSMRRSRDGAGGGGDRDESLGSFHRNGCIRTGLSGGCTQPPQAVLEGPPDGAAPRDVPLPRLRTAIARMGIGVVPGMLTRWRQWVAEWNDNRDDGIRKQVMKEAIFVGDKAQGVGAVAIYANRQLEQWMEQWQIEAEIIADTQRQEMEERASDGQAATKKGRWKSPQ